MKYTLSKPINGSRSPKNITQLHSHVATEPRSHTTTELHSHRATYATYAIHDSAPARFDTLQRTAQAALESGLGENCCWMLARAVKAFELETGKSLESHRELCHAFAVWWSEAKDLLPADADFEEYQDDFINCYQKAVSPLGQNALEMAMSECPTAADVSVFGAKKAKLIALCRALQRLSGEASFFLGVRDAAKVMGTKDLFTARNTLAALVSAGVLVMERKGQIAGRKATRYRFLGE